MQKRDLDGRIIRESVKGLIREQIVAECSSCNLYESDDFHGDLCTVYQYPKMKWRLGDCNMATHTIARTKETDKFKRRVGQQKGKKK